MLNTRKLVFAGAAIVATPAVASALIGAARIVGNRIRSQRMLKNKYGVANVPQTMIDAAVRASSGTRYDMDSTSMLGGGKSAAARHMAAAMRQQGTASDSDTVDDAPADAPASDTTEIGDESGKDEEPVRPDPYGT